ncbi:MAG: acetyl-CoA carboxylase carboxyltransferase subunit alpha [candidate division Zixibacteria bacterium]|nr:acetyl-CoA carboxylase carboxyltransferase subunit alpha [candidate division Zixibacteria bacterium]NIR68315.1 acetyl-CoA carboxylase carboxyltransferase subunit alpha [candidate division Zixibacteria bacterium]NIS18296.1 acetyl-CoA carboxylase carboxyltransferase subunit alpha [candidate division Zixibacteria bacterium]NIS49482.1 acetyl-CoA carboxylase carboxyltransferase subunit alpha [candidate division Zixibacteria bacterium]NIT54619.1 acetyl-CoA carboxylase carboxyltransferase subunit a
MSAGFVLEFEKPIVELERKIAEMKEFASDENVELSREIESLEQKLDRLADEIYSKLTRWEKVQLARHPRRPYSMDYINALCKGFIEVHGDRGFADDKAVVCGFGQFNSRKVALVGQQKARDTKGKLLRNFGMMHPEGYRKALRVMRLAEKFELPILIFIDTPGAYPGIGAEERGQAEAIARNIREMFRIKVPIIISIIGEGASGGALGIGVGDVVLMLENAWYSVISPEGCAAILWRDQAKAPEAAEALKLTAQDMLELEVIDKIIPEPRGGAHRNPQGVYDLLGKEIHAQLEYFDSLSKEQLLEQRTQKFRRMGEVLQI